MAIMLRISRWKCINKINESVMKSASAYLAMEYWTYNWCENIRSKRMLRMSKET
jgi:predicted adenine nucleotide alpha hydrolase (AANH) superfamily ATPase